jgi:hypothetical protein
LVVEAVVVITHNMVAAVAALVLLKLDLYQYLVHLNLL